VEIFWLCFFTVNALAGSCITIFAGVDWSTLTKQQRFVQVLGAAITWTNTMMALAKQARTNLVNGTDPLNGVMLSTTTTTTKTLVQDTVADHKLPCPPPNPSTTT
jgi:flagellar hook-basal body complex protein FliE